MSGQAIGIDALLTRFPRLQEAWIVDWVARGWVRVEGDTRAEWRFSEIAVARLHLLRDLRVDMEVDETALPVVLSLLDQVYDLRRTLRDVISIVHEAPEEWRRRVLAVLTRQD